MNLSTKQARRSSEFRGQTRFVAGGFIAMFVSMPAIIIYSLSALIPVLQDEFGWSRAQIAFAYTIANLTLLVGSTIVGHLADRYDARFVGMIAIGAFGLGFSAVPLIVNDINSFYLAYFLAAAGGVGATSVVLLRPVLERFDKQRGLALGISMSGSGLAALILPQLTVYSMSLGGWRAAYWALGLGILLSLILVWWFWRPNRDAVEAGPATNGPMAASYGVSFKQGLRTRQFAILSVVSFVAGGGTTALLVHLVPLYTDLGLSLRAAASYASLLGLAAAVGRFGAGIALDWWRSPLVGLLLFGLACLGLAILRLFGTEHAIIAMLLCGLAIGAEADLFAYFCTRYFGTLALGAIYGWMYGLVALGGAIMPFGMGLLRDRSGSYDLSLSLLAVGFGASALLMIGLGRFRYGAHRS